MNICPKCNIAVAVGDVEKKTVGSTVYHGSCFKKLPMNTRVRPIEQQLCLRLIPRL